MGVDGGAVGCGGVLRGRGDGAADGGVVASALARPMRPGFYVVAGGILVAEERYETQGEAEREVARTNAALEKSDSTLRHTVKEIKA